jgi:hypothetical protein
MTISAPAPTAYTGITARGLPLRGTTTVGDSVTTFIVYRFDFAGCGAREGTRKIDELHMHFGRAELQ